MKTEAKNSYKIFFHHPKGPGNNPVEYCYKEETDIPGILRWLLDQPCRFKKCEWPKVGKELDGFYPVWVKIHSAEDLLTGQVSSQEKVNTFAQELLKDGENGNEAKLPIIHIATSDLFIDTLFGTASLPADMPRSYMIMDSSIWNYLVPLGDTYYVHDLSEEENKIEDKNKVKQDCKTNFYQAVCSICRNYEKHLYNLKVAVEFANFNARLAEQSFLSGAHASGVSPFIFHSERSARQLIQREFRLCKDSQEFPYDKGAECETGSVLGHLFHDYKWRILLLDDKAFKAMEASPENDTNGDWNCKLSVLQNILENQLSVLKGKVVYRPCPEEIKEDSSYLYRRRIDKNSRTENSPFGEKKVQDDTVVLIEYAQSMDVAQEAIKKRKYDIVLLDYLLNEPLTTHYGYELLDDIWKDQQQHKDEEDNLKYKVRPHSHHRLYCMFISAYSSAVHDRLLAEGLNQSEDYWYINLGACPTNTPQLFLYNLLKLMDKRVGDLGIDKLTPKGIINQMLKIYKNPSAVRKNANQYYHSILSLQYYYRGIIEKGNVTESSRKGELFDTEGSVLMTDFIQKYGNLGGLVEHMSHLVHLTAFGTIRQWPEMWEEYVYFRSQFSKLCSKPENKANAIGKEDSEEEELYEGIENYILNLKLADR